MECFVFKLLRQIKRNSIPIQIYGYYFFFEKGVEYVLFSVRFNGPVKDLFLANIFACIEEKREGLLTTAKMAVSRAKLIEWYRYGGGFSEYEKSLK